MVFVSPSVTAQDLAAQHQQHWLALSLEELVARRQEDEWTHSTCVLEELK